MGRRRADGVGVAGGVGGNGAVAASLNAALEERDCAAYYLIRLWGAAISAAAMAWGIKLLLPPLHPTITALPVLGGYGVVSMCC